MNIEALQDKYGNITSEEAKLIDNTCENLGISSSKLMHIAGWQIARLTYELLDKKGGSIFVIAGKGNNGGDGCVAATFLAYFGFKINLVILSEENSLNPDIKQLVGVAKRSGCKLSITKQLGKKDIDISSKASIFITQ